MSNHASRPLAWLDVADVIALHQNVMERMGEAAQPHNPGRLEGAVMRPRMVAFYEGIEDPVSLGALLAVGISQAQAFLDGNKRTGYSALSVFLRINGIRLAVDWLDVAKHLEAIAEASDRDAATDSFATWLRANAEPRTP
jgi:death on curing protein